MLSWTRRLVLQRMHPWPHRDGVGPGIVEGEPHQGAPAIVTVVVAIASGIVVLAIPLALTLVVATVIGVGGRTGRGHRRTWQFLLWWAWR
jgi:hypothetical protein